MKSRLLLCTLCFSTILSLIPVAGAIAQGDQAKLIVVNYVGQQMTFTLDGVQYTIPGTGVMPEGGRLALDLAPGRHTYSAQVPGAEGANGEVVLLADQTRILGARLERVGPVVSPAGIVLEEPTDQLTFFDASLTPPAPTPETQPAPLQPLPPDKGALVFVNYIGEAVKIDVHGNLYTVPANGRLQVDLSPGEVSFSASAGLSGTNSTARVVPGEYTGLGFSREIGPEEPDYQASKPVPTPVPLEMRVFPVSLEDIPISHGLPTPETAVSPEADKVPVSLPGQESLLLINYIGEELTFTINDQVYRVSPGGGRLTLNLAPGEYTFTASTPRASTNGRLRVEAGQITRVSAALNMQSGSIELYIE